MAYAIPWINKASLNYAICAHQGQLSLCVHVCSTHHALHIYDMPWHDQLEVQKLHCAISVMKASKFDTIKVRVGLRLDLDDDLAHVHALLLSMQLLGNDQGFMGGGGRGPVPPPPLGCWLPPMRVPINHTRNYTMYNEKYFSDGHFSYIVCVL